FVVAIAHPTADADPVIRRVLYPGRCPKPQARTHEICLHGFPDPARPATRASFPISALPFTVYSGGPADFAGPWPGAGGITILELPAESPLQVAFPPSTRVEVQLLQRSAGPITVTALNSARSPVASAATSGPDEAGETLTLEADEIVAVVVVPKHSKGASLVGLCVSQGAPPSPAPDAKRGQSTRLGYTGSIDLDLRAPRGDWAVVLVVQGVNNLPPGTDPAEAARLLGGITASANLADIGACVVVELLDHVFHVF
ncbi:MAG TPA: hypothetical protein VHW26_09780, partial [Solirubrobacteraceae bacterium]|nr:hypothetical protein [Solirubrobacteraceae bacterium]